MENEDNQFDYRRHRFYGKFVNYKVLMKDFNSKYREFHKWIKEWHSIIKETEGKRPVFTPNKDSIYYKAALELAEGLSTLWFISEVRLFGSVAKGQETKGSDIDIAFKVGIDIKDLTIARKETMYRAVEIEVRKVEDKYEDLVKQSLDKKYGDGKDNIFRAFAIDKLFDLLAIQFQKKKQQKKYEALEFFRDSVVLFQTDNFDVNHHDVTRKFNFLDIEHVLFPTNDYHSVIINKKDENEDFIVYEYIKFDYLREDESKYGIDYIAYQLIDKKVGFSEYDFKIEMIQEIDDIFNPLNYQNKYSFLDGMSRDCGRLFNDALTGGIVQLKTDVPNIFSYHKYNVQK